VAQVITLKLYGWIAFVTEGQTPVTNGLEVGIAVIVTFLFWTLVFGLCTLSTKLKVQRPKRKNPRPPS
jgi:hypothetical protein